MPQYGILREWLQKMSPLSVEMETLDFKFQQLNPLSAENITLLQDLYEEAILFAEALQFANAGSTNIVDTTDLSGLVTEYDSLYQSELSDSRYQILLTIPVADRPLHLESCLQSLVELLQLFPYGRSKGGEYIKLTLVIADDSCEKENILLHQELLQRFRSKGLLIDYFGLNEQQRLWDTLPAGERGALADVIGRHSQGVKGHKGASIMRNLAYLHLQNLQGGYEQALCYFIDSDQEFSLGYLANNAPQEGIVLPFFFHFNRLFRKEEIDVLTGKVVGDPPVSPAVMAANCLEDLNHFFIRMGQCRPEDSCCFHRPYLYAEDASYHDMADLFGFKKIDNQFDYVCDITGVHDHRQTFSRFAAKLNRFFDGEHPTRKSFYRYSSVVSSLSPARTIYTGNYILRAEMLHYFIPFAGLKLRMAGPVLGRILQAELGDRFVSANLPMLHRRTVQSTGEAEYRAGVEKNNHVVDLSAESLRQFYGDVMLFTVAELTFSNFPKIDVGRVEIETALGRVSGELEQRYLLKNRTTRKSLKQLEKIYRNHRKWWHLSDELAEDRLDIERFLDNMEQNFWGKKKDSHNREKFQRMVDAISDFKTVRKIWGSLLSNISSPAENIQ